MKIEKESDAAGIHKDLCHRNPENWAYYRGMETAVQPVFYHTSSHFTMTECIIQNRTVDSVVVCASTYGRIGPGLPRCTRMKDHIPNGLKLGIPGPVDTRFSDETRVSMLYTRDVIHIYTIINWTKSRPTSLSRLSSQKH
ncbi:hypothetical protein ScPMuIL_011558 [Solemya velum]